MATKNSVSNEDILELLQESMQMTAEGFDRLEGRMDGLEGRMGKLEASMDGLEGRMGKLEASMGGIENRISTLERQYSSFKETVDKIAGEQVAQTNDIKEILDRLLSIEKRLPNITELEIKEMQTKLQALVDWAVNAAEANNIPLRLPN